jgi:ribosome-associated translation inhibitor RaiA
MKLPLQIAFKNIQRSDAITNIVKEKAEKLDRLCPEIIGCRVTITMPHKSHHQGNFFHITIDISLTGKELVVSRESQDEIENKDFYHVLKEAFDAAYRQVEDYRRMRRAS